MILKPVHRALLTLGVVVGMVGQIGDANARIPPMEKGQLEQMANLIIEGTVMSSTFLEQKMGGHNVVTRYSSVVRIDKIYKGDYAKGELITIDWFTRRWNGEGIPPDGHWAYPTLRTCQRFHAFLSGGQCKKPNPVQNYSFVHYNAKTCKKNCAGGTIPTEAIKVRSCSDPAVTRNK